MSIRVVLPREASGQEILDAFRAAATFQESPRCKWEAHGYATTNHGDATVNNTFVSERGFYATPAYLRRRGFIFKRREYIWKTNEGLAARFLTQIKLAHVAPHGKYSEVTVEVHHEYNPDPVGGFSVTNDPDDSMFSSFRSAYDKIITVFLKQLA